MSGEPGARDAAAAVRRQYEGYPYPSRDPADEDRRLLRTSLDALPAVNHYGFKGRRDFRAGFRVLVAGCGTGDASTFLAEQLRGTHAEIVALDLSAASVAIARQRAERRGLEARVTWRVGSLLDLPAMGLGPFDYVNCSGVLHHLPDPGAGLAALRAVLKDDGLMGLMVYAPYGRAAIYALQALLRTLLRGVEDPGERIRAARMLLAALPDTHPFRRLPPALVPADLETDAGIHDLLLHPIDRAFSVPELHAWLGGAGLRLVEVAPSLRVYYEPRFALSSPELAARAAGLPREERQALSELAWNALSRHVFWAAPRDGGVADPRDPENVPFFFGPAQGGPRVAEALQALVPGQPTQLPVGGDGMPPLTARLTMGEAACRFLREIDGRRTMGEIAARVAPVAGSEAEAWRTCVATCETLRIADAILLRHVSVEPLPDVSRPGRSAAPRSDAPSGSAGRS